MKAKKFVLIYFKTVKAKRSTQGTEQSELAAKQNELTPKQKTITAAKLTQQIHWETV